MNGKITLAQIQKECARCFKVERDVDDTTFIKTCAICDPRIKEACNAIIDTGIQFLPKDWHTE